MQANWLKRNGVGKGEAVAIYLPMLCELPIAMLACARIGATHSVIFGGFSADALAARIANCGAKVVLTATGGMRGKKLVPLKQIVDQGLAGAAKLGAKVKATPSVDASKQYSEYTEPRQISSVWPCLTNRTCERFLSGL